MKRTLTLLGVGIIPCAIVFLLFFTGLVDSCSDRKTENVISQVEINEAKRQVADSINAKWANDALAKVDSTARRYERKLAKKDKENAELRSLVDNQVEGFYNDTLASEPECTSIVAKCDSALTLYAQYADSLNSTIDTQRSLLVVKDSTISIYQQKYRNIELSYKSAQQDVLNLHNELSSKQTWWKRNEKWIYFVGGILTIKLITK